MWEARYECFVDPLEQEYLHQDTKPLEQSGLLVLEGKVVETLSTTQLHEAQVLAEYGEAVVPYVRAQALSKAMEAIGLPSLSVWEREVDEQGQVLDYDGDPMSETTESRLELPVADFERGRNQFEHMIQVDVIDKMQPGEVVVVDSNHPHVDDDLAAAHGYSPMDRWLMKQVFHRAEDSLVLYNYSIPHGRGKEGITYRHASRQTTIELELARYDRQAEAETGIPHFLGEVWTGEDKDYALIHERRQTAEAKVEEYIVFYLRSLAYIGERQAEGQLSEYEAKELQRRYERAFHTILLVELNPERAQLLLAAEDYTWMQLLLDFDPEEAFGGAYDIAERNQLTFIACGGLSSAELDEKQEWYGAYKTIGRCVNCLEGPQEIGEKGWCRGCITGHCGTR